MKFPLSIPWPRLFSLWLLSATVVAASAQVKPNPDMIFVQAGKLPILITAPHGGTKPIPEVPVRTEGVVTTDVRTFELATAVSERLAELLGEKPYVVAAKFQRKCLDVNRAPAEAFQDEHAKPVYEAYHGQIRNFVDEIRQHYPNGALMIDFHGQAKGTNTIFRGTQNGRTVTRLLEKRGLEAFTGTNSLLGHLQGAGYDIFPLNTPPGKPAEDRAFNGGYTVGTYGSHRTNGIDAIQCEFGTALRTDEARRNRLANDVADAVAAFYRAYLVERAAAQK